MEIIKLVTFSGIDYIQLVNELDGLLLIEQSLDWFISEWFIVDGYSSWLYGNWVTELLVDY